MSTVFEPLPRVEQDRKVSGAQSREVEEQTPGGGNGFSEDLVVLKSPGSVAAEQFRFLRAQIIRPKSGAPPRTVLISSSLQGEGKTFAACNLAVTVAQGMDEHVLLVDTDLRNPMVHNIFGIGRSPRGLATYLARNEPLSALLHKSFMDKLTILPAGEEPDNPAELLSSQKMHSFISEVRDRYPDRLAILDSSPVILAPETMSIANEVDAVLLMVLRGATPRHVVRDTMERIKQEKLKGIIFNMDRNITRARYYGYGYSYRIREAAK